MIENKKIDCIDALVFGLNRTSHWRQKMAAKYPSDPRNAGAGAKLVRLSDTLGKRTEWEASSFLELRQREAVPGIARRNPRLPETPTASVAPLKRMARNESVSPFLSTPTRWTWRFLRSACTRHRRARSITRLCNK
jgi:hypothetical protein